MPIHFHNLNICIMAIVNYPACNNLTKSVGYPTWVIIVAICFSPLGLLALLTNRNPTTSYSCVMFSVPEN